MQIRRVKHIAVATAGLEALNRLFGDAFKLPLIRQAEFESGTKMAMFKLGNMELELLQNPSPSSLPGGFVERHGQGYFHVCLEVDSVEDALTELAASGVRALEGAPRKGSSGGVVVFLDPATTGDLLIELAEPIGSSLQAAPPADAAAAAHLDHEGVQS